MVTRPDWDEWALGIAAAVALRGDCTRRQVGAVILDTRNRIAGAGYNGAAPGGPSCLAGECPRGRHYQRESCGWLHEEGEAELYGCTPPCACGNDWPCPGAVPAGSSYDTGPGACISTHAEMNAILDVSDRWRLDGAALYVTTGACDGCRKIVWNSTQIGRIVWPEGNEHR